MQGLRKIVWILLLVSVGVSANQDDASAQDPMMEKHGAIAGMLREYDNPFVLYPYDRNYLIYTYGSRVNRAAIASYDWAQEAKHDEAQFQLSLGFPIWRGVMGENSVLAASYTQRSFWQALNHSASSPFRETNYEPQVFLGWSTEASLWGWSLAELEMGLNHQSNGRSDPTSRSWNRVYGRAMAHNGAWQIEVKPWLRIREKASSDDNRDITRYLGYYTLTVGYQPGDSIFSLKSRYNWNTGYGSAELGWSYPLTKHVRLYSQLSSGYGESLIDYNFQQTRFGIGFMLNDIM